MTKSFIPGIELNETAASGRSDTSPGAFLTGVLNTLHSLTTIQPCVTSKAVINAISASGKTVTIVPARQTRFSAGNLTPNAATDADNPRAATAPGKPVEDSSDLGIGGGSNSTVQFTPQDWDSPSSASLDVADEVLLHELIHAMRQARGLEDNTLLVAPMPMMRRGEGALTGQMLGTTDQPTKLSQIYHSIEDFCSILIANIYRSENNRPGLVRDHYARGPRELGYPLTNGRNFLSVWRPQIERLQREMPDVCGPIAAVPCHFNPIRETRLTS